METALGGWVSGLIEAQRFKEHFVHSRRWHPGDKLKLLFAGYNGTRNTGADVRVKEILRQIRHILSPGNVKLSVLSQNVSLTKGYFSDGEQKKLPNIFPPMLYREVPDHDGVVACEGSRIELHKRWQNI